MPVEIGRMNLSSPVQSWKHGHLMTLQHAIKDPQSPSEERFNLLSHGFGLVLSLIGLGALLALSAQQSFWKLLACVVYGGSVVSLFAASTWYHACKLGGDWTRFARVIDHCAILVMIAGSYTPFLTMVVGGWKGWTLLFVVWGLAAVGIRHKFTSSNPFGNLSVLFCFFMSSLVFLVWPAMMAKLGWTVLAWLVAGGAAYVVGVPFYVWATLPHNHGIWHLFVLAGAGCHFRAVLHLL